MFGCLGTALRVEVSRRADRGRLFDTIERERDHLDNEVSFVAGVELSVDGGMAQV